MKALITALMLPLTAGLLLGCSGKEEDTESTGGPELSASHESLEFGSVDFGLGAGLQITIANVGDEPLTISSAGATSPWRVDTEIPETFEPGDSLGVNIGFLGAERGDLEGSFTLTSNDPTTPELVIPLTATVSSPPTVFVTIEPSKEVYSDTTLEAFVEVGGGDDSNLELTYSWLVDDLLIDQVVNPTLPGTAHFDKHQTVRIVVTPRVGDIILDNTQDEVTVLNSPPSDPVIFVVPDDPEIGEDFVCEVDVESVDVDPEDAKTLDYSFEWTLNDMPSTVTPSTTYFIGDTIPGNQTEIGQRWTCTLTVTDGDGISSEPQSFEVRISGD